jgi:hypothetical protein
MAAGSLMTTAVLWSSVCIAADPIRPARNELGRTVKLRIMVDKVMQPVAKWRTEEWMVQATADAGFNVYSPRVGFDDLEAVASVTDWCTKAGIYHLVWMRGTLSAPDGPEADGKRVVWANGVEQPLWSVNSDEFWDWTARYVLDYARISASNPSLMGVFLDYENYAKGKQGNLYSLSYDSQILAAFAADRQITIPELPTDRRAAWLRENGLDEAFETYQTGEWRRRCRTLRERVDAIDPTFQFCIYPAPGTPFMLNAAYPEWSTPAAPIIFADASTYGRPDSFLPERLGLEKNRSLLKTRMAEPAGADVPFIYTGGIDPAVRGADPEFCGKNAVAIADVTDGYWVFYEGPKYDGEHPQYWQWFSWANDAIRNKHFDLWKKPRETAESWTIEALNAKGVNGTLHTEAGPGTVVAYPEIRFRGPNLFLLQCRRNTPVAIALRNVPVGNYVAPLTWSVRDSALDEVTAGTVGHDTAGNAAFTVPQDGMYLLTLTAGRCAYSVESANTPMALLVADRAAFIYGAKELAFAVPPKIRSFKIRAGGMGSETVRLTVKRPDGTQAGTAQTTPMENRAAVTVNVQEPDPNGVWTVTLGKADEGVLEDCRLYWDSALPPIVSLAREHVFR